MSRLDDQLAGLAALKPVRRAKGAATAPPAMRRYETARYGDDELAALLDAQVVRNRFGEHLRIRHWFPGEQIALNGNAHDAVRMLAPEAPKTAADPTKWILLDTETTGLAGGTGTYAFLVGVAWWDGGGLQVEQLLMRDHSEEHSLLAALAERLAERRVLVTFNGKSFDWPLLETRYRMTRALAPRQPAAHLDLLHPARHLWRLRLGSLRLAELERHVAGFHRGPDFPSWLIPQAYFDYLRTGVAHPLRDVVRHNQMDLRGLAALAARMLALIAAPEQAGCEPLELYGLSRLFRRRGDVARARQLYERAIIAGLPRALDRAARCELARLAKRERDYDRATAIWHELTAQSSAGEGVPPHAPTDDTGDDVLEAHEQLAIYYEHRARNPLRAAELTREALSVLGHSQHGRGPDPVWRRKWKARLEHRLARLEKRPGARSKLALEAAPELGRVCSGR